MSRARSPRSAAPCASPCSSRRRTPWCRRRSPCSAPSTRTCASRSPSASPTLGLFEVSARDFDLVIAEQYPGHTRAHRDDLDRVHLAPTRSGSRCRRIRHPLADAPPGRARRKWVRRSLPGRVHQMQRMPRATTLAAAARPAVGARARRAPRRASGPSSSAARRVRARRALRDGRPHGAHPAHPLGQRRRAAARPRLGGRGAERHARRPAGPSASARSSPRPGWPPPPDPAVVACRDALARAARASAIPAGR